MKVKTQGILDRELSDMPYFFYLFEVRYDKIEKDIIRMYWRLWNGWIRYV